MGFGFFHHFDHTPESCVRADAESFHAQASQLRNRGGDTWTMAGLGEDETLNAASVSSLHNQVISVRMTAPIGKEAEASFGLDDPQAVVTLETGDGETHTLQVGAQQADDNSYVFSSSDSPYYVRVAEFTGSNLIDKTRADFLEAPPAEDGATGTESTQ